MVTCVSSSCLLESCEERGEGRGERVRKENEGEKERGNRKRMEDIEERVGGKERERWRWGDEES